MFDQDCLPLLRPERCPVCGSISMAGDRPRASCGHLLWFAARVVGGVTVVPLSNARLAVMELLDLLDHAIDDGIAGRIVLNFGGVQQVSSAALGKLVKLMHHADAVRGRLKLCGLHADLAHVLRITRLDRVFEVYDSETQALASFVEPAVT